MAIALRQCWNGIANTTTATSNNSSVAVAVGSVLLAFWNFHGSSTGLVSPLGTWTTGLGNLLTAVANSPSQLSGGGGGAQVFGYVGAVTAGGTESGSWNLGTQGTHDASCFFLEFTGVNTASPLDSTAPVAWSNGSFTGPQVASSYTPSQIGSCVVAAAAVWTALITFSSIAYTVPTNGSVNLSGATNSGLVQYVLNASGAQTPNFTASTNVESTGLIVGLRAAPLNNNGTSDFEGGLDGGLNGGLSIAHTHHDIERWARRRRHWRALRTDMRKAA